MKAGEHEFRYRFWIFFGLFGLAYQCYSIDHVNAGQWLLRRLVPGIAANESRERHALQLLFGLGALLALKGAALRTWASAYLRSAVVHDGRVHAEALVADGPYRHVRNPLYLGNQLLMLGVAPTASRLGALILCVGGLIFHLRLIGREESELAATQGERFRAYCARVPMFIPRLVPGVPPAGGRPNWGEAFLGEAFMWLMGPALIAFAVTLDGRSLLYTSIVGTGLYWAITSWLKRRAAVPSEGQAPRE